jgi:hypothetical protein
MCEKCGKEIKGESLGLGESFFHASCLTCTTCKENLAGLPVSRDQAGNIYCTRDYDRSPVAGISVSEFSRLRLHRSA